VLPKFQTAFILNVNSKDIYFERLLSALIHLMSLLHKGFSTKILLTNLSNVSVCVCLCKRGYCI